MTPEVMWMLIGLGTILLGPAGAAWVDVRRQVQAVGERVDGRIDTMIKEWEMEREFTRGWLKQLSEASGQNTADIAFLKGRDGV